MTSDAPGPQTPVRILLVDDHDRLRQVLATALAGAFGAPVDSCADVPTALSRLTGRPYDVLVMDVNLPGTSGLDALPQLRATCPTLRIVMMSGAVVPGLEGRALRAGADAFVAKSGGLAALSAAVRPPD